MSVQRGRDRRRVRTFAMALLESMSHCVTDYDWLDAMAAERAALRCPDYIPEWVMEPETAR